MDSSLQQIQDLSSNQPNFQQQVAQAYQNPIIAPLTKESADLNAQILPSLFQPFTQWGTGAGDLSAADKLSAIGNSVGRLGSQITANNQTQDFYKNQVDNLANTLQTNYQNHIQNLKDLYSLQTSRIGANAAANPTPFPTNTGAPATNDPNRAATANIYLTQMKQFNDPSNPVYQNALKQLTALGYDANGIAASLGSPAPVQTNNQQTVAPIFNKQASSANLLNLPGTKPLNSGLAGLSSLYGPGGRGGLSFQN